MKYLGAISDNEDQVTKEYVDNQYAFSNMKAGSVTVSAAAKTDTFEFVAGNNISLLADAYDKTLTISASGGDTPVTYDQGDSQDLQDGILTSGMVWSAKDLHDYPLTVASAKNHAHGKITNAGDCTTNSTIASGDRIMINDESAGYIANSSITFGSSTTTYLANNGTWQTPAKTAFVVQTASTSSASATAGNNVTGTLAISKSGYTPIGIVGIDATNTSGANITYLNIMRYRLTDDKTGVYYAAKNTGSSTMSGIVITFYVLWQAN